MSESPALEGKNHRNALGLICVLAFSLYSLGINNYVQPTNGDDTTYFLGALSLARGEGYTEQGLWIEDWPPVQSALTALAILCTGVEEFYIVKFVNLFAVLLSLVMAYRFMLNEDRSHPMIACLLIATSPTSLLNGTAGQADFTYFALSLAFFFLLERLKNSRCLFHALLLGLVLGTASLTRYQGVLLGVGILFQAWQMLRAKQWKSLFLEGIAASMGAAIFLGWKYWIHKCRLEGITTGSNYDLQGQKIWWQPDPLELGGEILNFFSQLENAIYKILPNGDWLVSLAAIVLMAILAYGFYLRVREVGWRATDIYVLASLSLYTIYAYKEARYFIHLAPFLLDYFFRALAVFFNSARTPRMILALWFSGFLAIDGILLFHGDGSTMGPRCQLLLEDERSYTRGHYREIYDVCQELKENYPNAVLACDKYHTRIVRHYSGLETYHPGQTPNKEYDLYLEVSGFEFSSGVSSIMPSELQRPASLEGRLTNPLRRGNITIWQVTKDISAQ